MIPIELRDVRWVNVCIPPNLAVVFSLTVKANVYKPGARPLSILPVISPLLVLRVSPEGKG